MIKALVFDCFGTLYGGSLETLAAMAPYERRQQIYDANIAKDYGYLGYAEYIAQTSELLGIDGETVAKIIREKHTPNIALIEYAKQARETYKTALLSNIGEVMMDELFDGKVQEYFNEVILSYKEGLAKPNPEIFTLTAERLGLRPEECVLIDDIAANCESANIVGMRSILHISNELTFEKLAVLLKEQ